MEIHTIQEFKDEQQMKGSTTNAEPNSQEFGFDLRWLLED